MIDKLEEIKKVSISIMGDDFLKNNKRQENVFRRSVFFAVCRELTKASLSTIGKKANKDHATVLYGIKLFYDEINRNEALGAYVRDYWAIKRICKKKFDLFYMTKETKQENMIHVIINQRQRIEELEKLIENIPRTVKMRYA